MNLLKTYYHYISDPEKSLQELLEQRAFKQALWGYGIATVSWVLFFNIASGISVPAFIFKLLALFALELTAGYFLASLCGLFLDFMDVKISPAELFILIGISGCVKGLLIAFALIAAVLPFSGLALLAPFALLLVCVLQLVYLTQAIAHIYQTSAGKALGAWLFSLVPITMAFILIGIFFIWGISLLF